MARNAHLPFHFLHTVLQVARLEVLPVHVWYKDRRVGEEIVHLLKRSLSRLGLNGPEEDSIGKVAHDLFDALVQEESVEPEGSALRKRYRTSSRQSC